MSRTSLNILSNYFGKAWTALISIIFVPFYIKLIGIESYGLIGFFTILSSVFGVLDFGISASLNRELAKSSQVEECVKSQRDLLKTFEIIYWIIALIGAIIILFFSPLIKNYWIKAEGLNSNKNILVIQLMAIALMFKFPSALYQGGLMGLQKQVLLNLILVVTNTIKALGGYLVLYYISATIDYFFFWQVFMNFIEVLVFFFSIWNCLPKSNIRPKFRISIFKSIWKYAAAVSGNAIIGVFLTQIDKVILTKMLPLKEFAYYTIANTAASSIWMIITPFNSATFPVLVKLHQAKNYLNLKNIFHKYSQFLSLLLLPISFTFIFFSKEILIVWINDINTAEKAYLILSLLVIGTTFNGLISLLANATSAFGWPMLLTYTNLFQLLITVPLIVMLVLWKQSVGASIAWIILNSIYILFLAPFFFKKFLSTEKKEWYLIDIIIPTMTSFSICIISKFSFPMEMNKFQIILWLLGTWFFSVFAIILASKTLFSIFKKVLKRVLASSI